MLFLVLLSRAIYAALSVGAAALLPAFDASADSASSLAVRWDVIHFIDIVEHGYRWEHQYAFMPAVPFLLRHLSPLTIFLLNTALAYDTTATLYKLSRHYLQKDDLARLVAQLSLIPLSPPTLYLAPYAEPFFTSLSYHGMLCCARKQWFHAAVFFTGASTFRSNGFFLAGFIVWGILSPYLQAQRLPPPIRMLKAVLYTAFILSPFIWHNLSGYLTFCTSSTSPEWCSKFPPLIYNHVQSAYWNNGLFRYWTFAQLPNLLIAFPPLFVLLSYSLHYVYVFCSQRKSTDPFLNPSIMPHAIHALVMSLILLFTSHTQIVLRLAPSMPFMYWACAYILTHPKDYPFFSRAWLPYASIWSVVSVVLWVAFLPPA